MVYDLRFESWLPFRRRSGQVEWLPPYGITDDPTGTDPIVALACPRPDFDAAVTEFLIGLFTVALDVEDEAAWRKLRDAPPTPETLKAALANLPDAFALDGPGARAFQDIDPMTDAESNEIESLLIDAPGDKTIKDNKDLFIRRASAMIIGRPAAAMAIITLQTYAKGGGRGYLASMRRNGPMTTLVEPRLNPKQDAFWQFIWANAETRNQLDKRDGNRSRAWENSDIFPWLSQTKAYTHAVSGPFVDNDSASPLQTYFTLPRRIRLNIKDGPCRCSYTGKCDTASIQSVRERINGVKYRNWEHPFSPQKMQEERWKPVSCSSRGVTWQDWLGILLSQDNDPLNKIAPVVKNYKIFRQRGPFRIVAHGYAMDPKRTAIALRWVQSELPGFPDDSLERIRAFAARAHAATEELAKLLMFQVKAGLFERPKDAPGDFSHVKQALWTETQATFFDMVNKITDGTDAEIDALCQKFRAYLRDVALGIFDRLCPIDGAAITQLRRPISARHSLVMTCEGYGKDGASFYKALQLEPPEKAKSKKGKAA
jgi:CRISPR system Cascade subunit CasA